jgi:hypothetical protein
MNRKTILLVSFLLIGVREPSHAFELTIDRTTYMSGREVPHYSIEGAPKNSLITWSSWKDGRPTGEFDSDYLDRGGFWTNDQGEWKGWGGTWSEADEGFWTKQATVNGQSAEIHFAVSERLTSREPTTAGATLGVANWGGIAGTSQGAALLSGSAKIQDLGAKNIYLAMTPNFRSQDYPGVDFGQPTSLVELADSAPFRKVLSQPFETVAIAAYPLGNADFMHHLNTARVYQEMYQLTAYLIQKYRNSGKTFILKDWEADHKLEELNGPGKPATPDQIATYVAWWQTRHQAVDDARRALRSVRGVQVLDAIEFNALDEARKNLPSVLRDVIPQVDADIISYSAYESVNKPPLGEMRRRILDDVEFIRNFPGVRGRPLIIGEYGFSELGDAALPESCSARSDCSGVEWGTASKRAEIATQAFNDAGIPLSYYWQIIDNPERDPGYGIIHKDGTPSGVYSQLQSMVQGNRVTSKKTPLAAALGFDTTPVVMTGQSRANRRSQAVSRRSPNDYSFITSGGEDDFAIRNPLNGRRAASDLKRLRTLEEKFRRGVKRLTNR